MVNFSVANYSGEVLSSLAALWFLFGFPSIESNSNWSGDSLDE